MLIVVVFDKGGKTTKKVATVVVPAKSLGKNDLLRRAKERKKQIEEEIKKTRVELWEMTLEEGMLLRLAAQYGITS